MTIATPNSPYPAMRLRRLRQHPQMRKILRETELQVSNLILPLFIHHGENIRNPISSMPGQFQYSVDQLEPVIEQILQAQIPAVLLFGIPEHKDAIGSSSWHDHGVIQQAVSAIKQQAPELLVITDVCFCEYTDHGHCGVMNDRTGKMDLDNDATLENLVKQAVSFAKAGADVIAPSGMVDGMVHALRHGLDVVGFEHIPILSYAIKFASSLYGPFREAAQGVPKYGDRHTYQMDIANSEEALREAQHDVAEGADMLMVKPASAYLDIIAKVKHAFPQLPLAAYHVSGEYAMIKAAAEKGWLDEQSTALEILTAIKRAGADIIITYYALDVAKWLKEKA